MSKSNPLIIETVADNLDIKDVADTPLRRGSRAVFFVGDRLCLLHLRNTERYTLPGGGIEPGETPEEAVIREVKEETGYTVLSCKKTVILKEYFSDSRWEHHYFKCAVANDPSARNLTHEEKVVFDQTVIFVPLTEALTLLGDANPSSNDPYTPAIHNRELMGLMHSLED